MSEISFNETVTSPSEGVPDLPIEVPEKFRNEDGSTNVEALLKSYAELEKARGGQPQGEPNEGAEAQATPQGETPKPAEVPIPEGHEERLNEIGARFLETGDLTAEDYHAVNEAYGANLPPAIIKQHFELQRELQQIKASQFAINTIQALGGPDQASKVRDWARQAIPEELQIIEAQLSQGGHAANVAAQGLVARYKAATGTVGARFTGSLPAGVNAITSEAQYMEALRDPRWDSSPEYRNQVRHRAIVGGYAQS